MRFERYTDPKEALDIGLADRLIHMEKITATYRYRKFRRGWSNDTYSFEVPSANWTAFLEMWKSGTWDTKKLIKMFETQLCHKHRRGIQVEKVSLKLRFMDDQKFHEGNYTVCEVGKGPKIYCSYMGKIYSIEVASHETSWWI